MSGVSLQQPISVILNSKYRKSYESIGDITFQLQRPISGAQRARLHQFATVYLAHLVRSEQAKLDFTIDDGTVYTYSVSLASLTDKYYDDIDDVVADINAIMAALFVDGSGQYATALKPTFAFSNSIRRITVACASPLSVVSANDNFWFKLGWANGTYAGGVSLTGPSWPSVVPLQEIYVEVDGMMNDTALLQTDSDAYHENTRIAEIVTLSNTRLGDLYSHQFPTVPTYPLICQPNIANIRVRLMDSTGQVITSLESDYRLTLSFSY
jgi:hypothetical protein